MNYYDEVPVLKKRKWFIYSASGKMIATMIESDPDRALWFARYKFGPDVRVE